LIRVLRTIYFALLWTALLGLAVPPVDALLYAARLASMPVPVALEMPIRGAKRIALSDTWHAPRPGGRLHEGVDIFASKGTPIYSTTKGIVMRRGGSKLGGNVVWVLGPGGQRHYYAHLEDFSCLSVGERIHPGTMLGYVGNTGNARTTPPHLHYGIYGHGGAINPFPLFTTSERRQDRFANRG
jgi:peptidoglycan LD-endopeptidase LytH